MKLRVNTLKAVLKYYNSTFSFRIVILSLHALVDFFTFIQDLQHVSALMGPSPGNTVKSTLTSTRR